DEPTGRSAEQPRELPRADQSDASDHRAKQMNGCVAIERRDLSREVAERVEAAAVEIVGAVGQRVLIAEERDVPVNDVAAVVEVPGSVPGDPVVLEGQRDQHEHDRPDDRAAEVEREVPARPIAGCESLASVGEALLRAGYGGLGHSRPGCYRKDAEQATSR